MSKYMYIPDSAYLCNNNALLLHKYAESGGMIWEENYHLWSSWLVGLGSPHTVSSLDQITLKDVDIPYLPQVSGRG